MPKIQLNANSVEANKINPAIINSMGVDRADLVTVTADGPINNDYAAELAFNEEPMEIMVHESAAPNAENPVETRCNGVNQFFFRGNAQTVKRKFVEILAKSKETAINTREVAGFDGERTTRIEKSTALKYPFSVIRDDNPRGADWLRKLLRANH